MREHLNIKIMSQKLKIGTEYYIDGEKQIGIFVEETLTGFVFESNSESYLQDENGLIRFAKYDDFIYIEVTAP